MTEQNMPPQDPQSWPSPAPDWEVEPLPHPAEPNLLSEAEADWESVSFPGTLPIEAVEPPVTQAPAASGPSSAQSADFGRREGELLQLIQDLNQCNDALLRRVRDLEEALERSEAALQIEVERSQQSQSITSAEAQAAIAQQQHQVAQLLSELDIANDAVRRTTIHNDTLQANLDTTKQRVAQLERECTLLQQRFTEKSNALAQAEATCRDLRSRLQRQQHYTLQFKAALEKCLDMSSHRANSLPSMEPTATHEPSLRPHPLAMPKAQQIKPWSSEEGPGRSDYTLEGLLRNLKSVGQGPSSPIPTHFAPLPAPPATPTPQPDPEAENCLWQDLERVIETSVTQPESIAPVGSPVFAPGPSASESEALLSEEPPELTFTEPSPWGAPLVPPPVVKDEDPAPLVVPTEPPLSVAPPSLTAESLPPVSVRSPDRPPVPTAPPVAPKAKEPSAATLPPLLNAPAAQSPSPLVYPLRPQKKLKSISAVQLPSFPRKQRSQ